MIEVEGPDGVIYEFPDGTSEDIMRAALVRQYAPPEKPDQLQGFMKGMWNAGGNLAPVMGMTNPMGAAQMQQQAQAAREHYAQREAQGHPSGRIGEVAGNIAVSAPTMFMGGPAVSGALQGYAMSEGDNLQDKVRDAGFGAVGGKLGAKALEGVAAGVRGVTDPLLRQLSNQGVKLTPGQVLGEAMQRLESKAASLPLVGTDIAKAGDAFRRSANVGALNEVLAEIGQRLPKDAQAGHRAVEMADDLVGQRYDDLAQALTLRMDPQLYGDLAKVGQQARMLTGELGDKYRSTLADLLQFGPNLEMAGKAFRTAESDLGAMAKNYSTSGLASERELGRVFGDAQEVLRDAVARQNPEVGKALADAHAAFRKLIPVERAAAQAKDGVFSGEQLRTAARVADSSRRKVASAKGKAPMQAYAEAIERLERAVPNSGTFDRMAAMNPFMWLMGAGAKAAYGVGKAAAKGQLLPRPPGAADLAEALLNLKPAATAAGAGGAASTQHPKKR